MSSIIKSPFVSFSEQKKTIEVISSNDVKIINPSSSVEPVHINHDVNDSYDDEDFEEYNVSDTSEIEFNEPNHEKSYEELVEEATLQADEIIEQAKENAAAIESEANERGFDEGFKAGKKQAIKEEQKLRQKLKEEIDATVEERNKIIENLQPLIAEIIQKLVKNMVGIQKFEPEVIQFLVKMGLDEVDLYGDLIIKVSHEDFDEVVKHKDNLTENMSDKVSFEILKDSVLKKNDCIIDTSLGSVNCSLNERMEGLLKQLQLIEKSFGTNED